MGTRKAPAMWEGSCGEGEEEEEEKEEEEVIIYNCAITNSLLCAAKFALPALAAGGHAKRGPARHEQRWRGEIPK